MEEAMKKLTILLIIPIVLFMVLPVGAQNRIGIVGGLNFANVNSDDLEAALSAETGADVSLANSLGFGFGGVLGIVLSENAALHLQPMYIQKGAKIEVEIAGFDEDVKFKLAYLEVPVMLKLTFGTSEAKPYVMAGPTIGYLLSAKVTNGDEEDLKDTIKDFDFGLGFGAGVSFPAGNNMVFVEGRYALGLTNVDDDPDDPIDAKTKGIQIFAGITFPLGGQ
jgi:opacity protein-like surface antigen